jgi:hypothetical protein
LSSNVFDVDHETVVGKQKKKLLILGYVWYLFSQFLTLFGQKRAIHDISAVIATDCGTPFICGGTVKPSTHRLVSRT